MSDYYDLLPKKNCKKCGKEYITEDPYDGYKYSLDICPSCNFNKEFGKNKKENVNGRKIPNPN